MDLSFLLMNDMKQLGFSEYECKAYIKLLENYPLTGYALSKHSGIPRSRIYDVLDNLCGKQMVFVQEDEKNKLYYPVEPSIFIKKSRAHYEGVFSSFSKISGKLYNKKKENSQLLVIRGRQNIISFVKVLIKDASTRIALSIWEDELDEIREELDAALEKGVTLRGIYFGHGTPYASLISHRRLKRYMAQKKERYMCIIIDGTHAISGVTSRGEESKATWTRDKGFIEVSEDYIAHDLVVNLYSASLGPKAYEQFEKFADKVHKEYFCYSDEEFATYKKILDK